MHDHTKCGSGWGSGSPSTWLNRGVRWGGRLDGVELGSRSVTDGWGGVEDGFPDVAYRVWGRGWS